MVSPCLTSVPPPHWHRGPRQRLQGKAGRRPHCLLSLVTVTACIHRSHACDMMGLGCHLSSLTVSCHSLLLVFSHARCLTLHLCPLSSLVAVTVEQALKSEFRAAFQSCWFGLVPRALRTSKGAAGSCGWGSAQAPQTQQLLGRRPLLGGLWR